MSGMLTIFTFAMLAGETHTTIIAAKALPPRLVTAQPAAGEAPARVQPDESAAPSPSDIIPPRPAATDEASPTPQTSASEAPAATARTGSVSANVSCHSEPRCQTYPRHRRRCWGRRR